MLLLGPPGETGGVFSPVDSPRAPIVADRVYVRFMRSSPRFRPRLTPRSTGVGRRAAWSPSAATHGRRRTRGPAWARVATGTARPAHERTAGSLGLAAEDAASYEPAPLPWDDVPHPADTPPASMDAVRLPAYHAAPEDPGAAAAGPNTGPSTTDALPERAAGEPSLRDAVVQARAALVQVRELAAAATIGGGELGGLVDLIEALDAGQAAAALLTARVQRHRLAPRTTGLTLESLLACQAPLPDTDRRRLQRTADVLRAMPQLFDATARGDVPGSALVGITSEARRLPASQRAALDATFADGERLRELDAEALLEAVRNAARSLAPSKAEDEERRSIERRFLSTQSMLDGTLTGYFELDSEAGATVLGAIEAAAPAPSSGPADVSRHALDDGAASAPPTWPHRQRGRQRADGLLRLAEFFLAGGLPPESGPAASANRDGVDDASSPADTSAPAEASAPVDTEDPRSAEATPGPGNIWGLPQRDDRAPRRARPRLLVLTDVATLTGHDDVAAASRLLWASIGGPVFLTPAAVRRLASDAELRLILHDDGEVLGTTSPTATIPVPLREAVLARDQGCRFPGCRAPVAWVDLHHVRAREHGGPTTADNLTALCRRHHTAVTTGGWNLTMTPDGVITVRRGRRRATGTPPHRRRLRQDGADPPEPPG